jgi:hypothetical protein
MELLVHLGVIYNASLDDQTLEIKGGHIPKSLIYYWHLILLKFLSSIIEYDCSIQCRMVWSSSCLNCLDIELLNQYLLIWVNQFFKG